MDETKVNKLYTTNGTDVWRLISYCRYPTATLENVETKQREEGAVGCQNFERFKELEIKIDKEQIFFNCVKCGTYLGEGIWKGEKTHESFCSKCYLNKGDKDV